MMIKEVNLVIYLSLDIFVGRSRTLYPTGFAGVNALSLIQTVFLKIRAVPVFPPFPFPTVQNNFDEAGNATANKEATDKKAAALLNELFWLAEAFGNSCLETGICIHSKHGRCNHIASDQ